MNERLHKAMTARYVDVGMIANKLGVDPKTVQRWVKGREPHPRHRWEIAKILGEREDYLWPTDTASIVTKGQNNIAEIINAFAHRADVPLDAWWDLFAKAKHEIDMFGYAMLFLPEQHPNFTELLLKKAEEGCIIRIALADPDCKRVMERDEEEGLEGTLPSRIRSTISHFRELKNKPNITLAYHSIPLYNSIFRVDDEMFTTQHMFGLHGSKAPLLHLRKLSADGVFSGFSKQFDNIWATAHIKWSAPTLVEVKVNAHG